MTSYCTWCILNMRCVLHSYLNSLIHAQYEHNIQPITMIGHTKIFLKIQIKYIYILISNKKHVTNGFVNS